ncbi:hypothetical protein F5051DRAFT_153054 [Lentinula edodes]|uniref:Uncharacterized protein n=1 Tax=Lentinula lateritia TaxID=40482 RepID=A0A9W9AMN5_9AGAR|nr:hypothetical protein F5051DRAFT_153054 [Lentinula edodes]KAJ4484237.1 hypothetical protein C8J55DRAFT_38685 [Lentinula edodes]
MRLNIAFFVVSFAAAAYALPITDVSNTNASVADGRPGAVLPRANSDSFFQSNSDPLESPTSGPPRSSISSRGASQTLKYTFISGTPTYPKGGSSAPQVHQLTQELIRKHIPHGHDEHTKLEPMNDFLGNPDEINFQVDMSPFGMGDCKATIQIAEYMWTRKHVTTVEATWREKYVPMQYNPDFDIGI